MSIFKNKKNDLYLSDKQPLTVGGKIALAISYIFLILWAVIVIVPISQIVISSFNGAQSSRLIIGGKFKFSFKHFEILFKETDYLKWMGNTLFVSITTAIIVIIIVSCTGYAYSRYRFKG